MFVSPSELYQWCKISHQDLVSHPERRTPFRLCVNSAEMGRLMARELVDEIQAHNARGEPTRAIIPCGPSCWYGPFTELVNRERVSLRDLVVFHMDECLDWQGRELPRRHPYNFRGFMEEHFYGPVDLDLAVPEANRVWLQRAQRRRSARAHLGRARSTSPTAGGARTATSPTTRRGATRSAT